MNQWAWVRIFKIVAFFVVVFVRITLFIKRYGATWNQPAVQQQWNTLLTDIAIQYRELAIQLQGLLIKLGQFLSARADVMPPPIIEQLGSLVDRVPAERWEDVRAVLEAEWGVPYGQVIERISEEPVASASIGVVYRAVLHSGEVVAIKVQRPRIRRILKSDFRAMRIVIWLASTFTSYGERFDLPRLGDDIVRTIGEELLFRKEVANGRHFQKKYEGFEWLRIPGYVGDWCTDRVIVMEWVDAVPITNFNFLATHAIDRKKLAERLFTAFLDQLLAEGKFHADPHQGNVLVQADGTLVLIDFGMVGSISRADAEQIRTLVQGILFGDYLQVVDALAMLGFRISQEQRESLAGVIAQLVDIYVNQDLLNLSDDVAQSLLADLKDLFYDQSVQVPSTLAFFARAVSIFMGLIFALDPDVRVIELSKPLVSRWLQSRAGGAQSSLNGAGLFERLLDFTWQSVPGRIADWGRIALAQVTPFLRLPKLYEQQVASEQRRAVDALFIEQLSKQRSDGLLFVLASSGVGLTGYLVGSDPLTWVGAGVTMLSLWNYRRAIVRINHYLEGMKNQ